MYKNTYLKAYIFFILYAVISSFSHWITKADYLDNLWWTTYSEQYTMLTVGNSYTEYFTGHLFIKNIVCSNTDIMTNSWNILKVLFKYNNSLSSVYSLVFNNNWTQTLELNKYLDSESYRFNSYILNWSDFSSVFCVVNWILFDEIPNQETINIQNNIIIDLLWFLLFFILFFALFPFYWKLFKKFSLKK